MNTKSMFRTMALLILATLLVTGCGRKEAPQIAADPSSKPQLLNLQYQVVGNILEMTYTLQGSPDGVGIQIDRTEIDPYCQCPGLWQRYLEDTPNARQVGSEGKKLVNLKVMGKEFLFRVRAVDVHGNIGPWSKMIRATGTDLSNQ
ncbi:hypothetical protein Ga0123462_2019 [Mariprofundus ferrinatatus]|uniref:Lipoprotein n=1 Tax=Mariprofundus ferrinatatus TaxID=1921087 RepID=A0A2K8LF09_9PROT|nr:hypothetical protein [Mariprofundus ferrinatatus]ATX82856.1 hypothetical protein Ga0123462_2019 [Mariprofundus ferrinatatus]